MSIETRIVDRDGDILTLEFVGIPDIDNINELNLGHVMYVSSEIDAEKIYTEEDLNDASMRGYDQGSEDAEQHDHNSTWCYDCNDIYKDGKAEADADHERDWFKGYRAGVEDTLDRRKRKARIAKARKGKK